MRMSVRRLVALVALLAFAIAALPAYAQKTVHVKEYKRKDGTVVKAHDRKAPGSKGTAPNPTPAGAATTVPPATGASTTTETISPDTVVYITKSGDKYHRAGCRYISKGPIATTLKQAVGARHTPCSVCKPPVLER